MKKIVLLFSLFVMMSQFSSAQYYYLPYLNAGQNPGGVNTDPEASVGNGLPTDWVVILGPSQSTPTWTSQQTLPFAFQFNGVAVTNYWVSSSGVLSFNSTVGTAPSYTNAILPDASIPDKSVCIWGLAGIGTNDNIVTKTFGTAPNRQLWIQFNSYSQSGWTASDYTYWSIVLEETTNNIYIVDQRTAATTSLTLTVGVQINSTTAKNVNGSPNLANVAGSNLSAFDNTYYEFIHGTQSAYDIATRSLLISNTLLLNQAPFQITGSLINAGTITVNSFTLNYKVNNEATISTNITGQSITSLNSYTYTHPQSWTPTSVGNYTIKVWANNINGNPDQNPANDTVTKKLTVVNSSLQRLVLHEAFTSSTCSPCVAGNTNLRNIFNANPNKFTCVKYQMSWPGNGDPYYTAEGGVRRNVYGVNSVPNLQVDGGLNINTASYNQTQFNTAYAKPAFMDISGTFSVVGQTVSIHSIINPITNIYSNGVLYIAIVENTTHNNVGGNGETSFDYVMKKMIPDANGTNLGIVSNGVPVTNDFVYTFQGSYRLPANALNPINHLIEHSVEEFWDLSVVVWIQDKLTKEVYQTAWLTKLVGIDEKDIDEGVIAIFPNPTSNVAYLHYLLKEDASVNIEIYNTIGQKVLSENKGKINSGPQTTELNTTNLTNGIYFVKLNIGNNAYVEKISIKH